MALSEVLGEERRLEIPAGEIVYRERGVGPPIVFLHGIVANGDLWRKVVPELAGEFRCVVPDWPLGSHRAPLNAEPDLTLSGLAKIVDDFLVAGGLDGVTLVANDTGGAIAQAVVGARPERIARLVLTPCDAFDNFLPPVLRHLQLFGRTPAGLRLLAESLRLRAIQRLPIAFGRLTHRPIDPEIMRSYTAPLRESTGVRRDFARLVRGISTRHTLEAAARLPRFDRPVLIAWALEDRLFPLAHGHRLARLFPNARLETIEDTLAFVPEDQPGPLARLVGEFAGAA
jgi:pimeloyl-ACP methyl ester carboxylesterase